MTVNVGVGTAATGTVDFVDTFAGSFEAGTLTFGRGTVDFGDNTLNIGQPGAISVGTLAWTGGLLTGETVDPASGALTMTGGTLAVGTLDGVLTQNGGTVAPDDPVADTTIEGAYLLRSAAALSLDLGGTAAAQYEQLAVNGAVNLNTDILSGGTGGSLTIGLDPATFCPDVGDVVHPPHNDGTDPIAGTFKDKPDGGSFDVACGANTVTFQIDYQGGDGNDVALTVTGVAAAMLTATHADDAKLVFAATEGVPLVEAPVLEAMTAEAPAVAVFAAVEDDLPIQVIDLPDHDALLL